MQSHLLKLFQPAHKIILVGQSLNSDLKAIKLMHPYVIDTSLIFDHKRGKPYRPSLKWLAIKYLKREIQLGRNVNLPSHKKKSGHDSKEDALACIDLVKLKLEKGLAFGGNPLMPSSYVKAQKGKFHAHGQKIKKSKKVKGRWKYYVGGVLLLCFLFFKN